ncbi:MAG: sulfotransferase [Gammaproteobacteria bacterium]
MSELTVQALLDDARREAGETELGDESFLAPLSVLVEAMNTEARLTPAALERQRREILDQLVNRLRMEAFFRRHPEISEQPVIAPVVIIGLQRTGTSKLFRVLGSDPQWNVLYTWQALYPVPFGTARADGPDPRLARAQAWVDSVKWMQAAHTFDVHAPEMEALLMMQCFMTNNPARLVPSHQRWCENADFRPLYRYLRRQLQFLQWQNRSAPGRRWMLKSPPHLLSLGALAEVFPDSTFVMTYRHPKASVGSMLKLVEVAQQNNSTVVDRDLVRDQWLRILSLSIRRFLEFRDAHPAHRIVDVRYRDVLADSLGVVERIYAVAGARVTDDTRAAVAKWEVDNPQHKEGAFSYRLEDYGLTDADIEREFAGFIGRYGHLF